MNKNTQCSPAPADKKEYINDVGKILVKENGKKKYYKPEEVKKAARKSKYHTSIDVDWVCWALSIFSSHSDFDAFHEMTGESCDYVAMKTEMLSGLATSVSVDWYSIPDLDIDASWLDLGAVLEGVFEGIGDFFGGIFEGL